MLRNHSPVSLDNNWRPEKPKPHDKVVSSFLIIYRREPGIKSSSVVLWGYPRIILLNWNRSTSYSSVFAPSSFSQTHTCWLHDGIPDIQQPIITDEAIIIPLHSEPIWDINIIKGIYHLNNQTLCPKRKQFPSFLCLLRGWKIKKFLIGWICFPFRLS